MAERGDFHLDQIYILIPHLNLSYIGEVKSQVWGIQVILFLSQK